MDIIIELAEAHPLVFLGLLGIGIVGAVLVFVLALKISQLLLRVLMVCLSLVAFCILGLIALATAEHVIAALQYQPPPPANTRPGPAPDDAPPHPHRD